MEQLKKVGKAIVDFLGVFIPNITFLVIFITFMVTIISRYFFKTPVTWSYEISVLGYMWTMFFGVGKAMEADEHVVFGLVYDAVKPRTQFVFKVTEGETKEEILSSVNDLFFIYTSLIYGKNQQVR